MGHVDETPNLAPPDCARLMAGSAIRQLLFTIDFHVARHLGFLWVVHATVLSDDRGLASMSLSDALTAIEAAQSRTYPG